ncbi:MAG: acetyl-CoA synthetase [Chloroflexota bacterium]|nr:AMP-binding protein [Caldilinea sp.]GIK76012.1 MAG: acetyl-CoA synthetase [Chloroflexota bacterium]
MSTEPTFPFGQPTVWQPNPRWIAESNLQDFMNRHSIDDYDALHTRARSDLAWFWDAALADLGIEFYEPYSQIVDLRDGVEFPRWCVGGKLNIIHNCLDKWQATPTRDRIALRWEGEEGAVRTFTYAELHAEVNRCANALRSLGLGKGDAVGLYMPMIPELAIAFLAVIKIGGIVLPLFSGYGHGAVVARLADAGAKAIVTADGLFRRGAVTPMKPTVDAACADVASVAHVIVVKRTGLTDAPWTPDRDHWWSELIPRQSAAAVTEITDAEDVLMLIYTSGTTGKPKGAVHTHCGFPIKAAQDMRHSMDLKPEDTIFWFTDMGWMMGPWLVFGALLNGATMVFYDGAPDFPDVGRVWALVERHRITHLGVSPTLIRSLKPHGVEPVQRHDLTSLRAVGSTGSPWDPESWLWTFRTVLKGEKPILNYSGGTEISGGILCGDFFRPLKPCAFSGPVVGMDADVVDEQGNPVRGAVGELVIRQPWIGMTRGFWRDRERYLDVYWRKLPGMWVHGDFAAIDEDGLWYILGRSDDTIKVGGKRLGPAEVEAILNKHPAVKESAVIGAPHPVKDQEVVGFCVLREQVQPSETLRTELIDLVTAELGKPLKPRTVRFVAALPKTRNAKVMHRLIRAAYLGEPLGDLSSLETAETIEAIRRSV